MTGTPTPWSLQVHRLENREADGAQNQRESSATRVLTLAAHERFAKSVDQAKARALKNDPQGNAEEEKSRQPRMA